MAILLTLLHVLSSPKNESTNSLVSFGEDINLFVAGSSVVVALFRLGVNCLFRVEISSANDWVDCFSILVASLLDAIRYGQNH